MPGLENIVELLSDSFSPAINLPTSNTKIHYSALRHSFQQLSKTPPFCNLEAKDVVLIALSNTDSIDFIAILAALNMRAVVNPVDDIFINPQQLLQHISDISPKLVICSAQNPKFEWFLEASNSKNIPFFSIQIQMHLQSLQIPKIVRKLSPVVTNQMSNIRPICSMIRVGRNSSLDGHPKREREIVKHDKHDIALLLLTKNKKKIVPLTHLNILESLELFSLSLSLNASDITILLPIFNFSTSSGLMILFSAFFSGSTVIILPPNIKSRSIWPIIKNFRVTWLLANPDFHQRLLETYRNTDHSDNYYSRHSTNNIMRFILSTGSKLDDDLLLKMEQKYQTQVLTCYTSTEAGFLIATHKPNSQRKLGSCGISVLPILILGSDGVIAKQNVVGDILISGPTVAQSYYSVSTSQNKEISFQGMRYLKTGDQGSLDERGFLTLQSEVKPHKIASKL